MSTWEFIADISRKSYFLIPLMALLLIFTIAVILERIYFYTRVLSAGEAMEHDVQLVKRQNVADLSQVSKHYEGTVQVSILDAALAARGESAADMERHIDETIMWQLPKMDRFLWLIDTSVTLGPLMGLLGTIFGMIESFNMLGTSGSSNPTAVTGGIAHALIATALGLFIAIVAVSFLNFFHKRLRLTLHQMDLLKVMVINRFHNDGDKVGASPPAAGRGVSIERSDQAIAGAK